MLLSYVVPPLEARGGVSRSAARMIAAMSDHEVRVISPDADLFPGDVREEGAIRFGIVEPWKPHDWVPFVADAIAGSDVVVGYYGTTAGHAACVAASSMRIPSLLCLRGNDVDRDADDPVRGPLLREAIECATEIATVSRAMAAIVRERFGREATFVAGSVDRSLFYFDGEAGERFRATHGLERPLVGLFGEHKEKRGLDRLAHLPSEWHVVLVGDVRPEVRHWVSERWKIIPHLDRIEDLRAAYSACDAVLQPSHQDGMPNVVLEAMACERTVIASHAGGLPDLIEHGINLFDHDEELPILLRDLPELGARKRLPAIEDEKRAMLALIERARRAPPAG